MEQIVPWSEGSGNAEGMQIKAAEEDLEDTRTSTTEPVEVSAEETAGILDEQDISEAVLPAPSRGSGCSG